MSAKRLIHVEIGYDPVNFTNNFIFTNYQVTYSTYLHLFHLFSFFQQSYCKTKVLLFPPKVLCWFYVLDCIVHVSKSFEHPIHSKFTFSIQFPSFLPKCIPYSISNPTLFHVSQTSTIPSIPFTFLLLLLLLSTLTTSVHLECCATPFILLFQRRNAHYHTSFLNSSNVTDPNFFFMFFLTHWRITSWNKQSFPVFFNLYSSS